MRITPSPLVKDLRGRAAGAVAAVWRGVNYVRSHNAHPHNPQTASQQTTRASMALLVKIWQHMLGDIKGAWDVYAEALPRSGWNCYTKANLAAQIAARWEDYTPSNPRVYPVESLALTSPAPNTLVFTWTPGGAVATNFAELACYKVDHPTDPAAVTDAMGLALGTEHNVTNISAGNGTIAGLTTGDNVIGLMSVYDNITGEYSLSLSDTQVIA